MATNDPIFALSNEYVDAFCALSPISASMAGVPGDFDGWDDYSPEGAERALAVHRSFLQRLEALPIASDPWARLARNVMGDFLREKIAYYESGDHLCDLNNIECPLQHVRVVFDVMDLSTAGGWGAATRRLATLDKALSHYRAALEEGARRGLVAAQRQVRATREQARLQASEKSSYYDLLSTFDKSDIKDGALRAALAAGIESTRAAFAEFGRFLDGYLEKATPKDAVGEARYRRSVRRFLGMELDLEETYAWGFKEIAAIEGAMRDVAAKIAPGKSVPDLIAELSSSPDQLIADIDQFLAIMRDRQNRALSELYGTHFDVPDPVKKIEVRLAPAGGALGAYYYPPNENFTRPGTVYYAPAEGHKYALFSEITTAYHEGFPGHHLQCGLQVYLADRLSRLHRLFVVCSGYAEGWALYAEQLMEELGYLDKPEYVLGMHMAKLFRACRVVADIGMHLELTIPASFDFHPGETWGYDLCVELLTKRAFVPSEFAMSEATRYLGWPAQAISYKVGERVILGLRTDLKTKLGDKFDLKRFHEVVLSTGSVGLDLLRDVTRESFA
ncbi:MAG: DUF885 domain-containing protein [Polyangiaceae bacterium]